jgi:hypothetical protein
VPDVDFDTADVLFVAFAESSSCPLEFLGLQVEGQLVRFSVPADVSTVDPATETLRMCTDDDRPRSLAMTVPIDLSPAGAARVRLPHNDNTEILISFDRN